MNSKGVTVFLLASAIWSVTAAAQEYARPPTSRGQQVKAYGLASETEVARGFGNEMPLSKAMMVIVPRGYALRTSGVDRWWLEQPVSWTGGRDWTEALREALAPYPELTVDISHTSRLVLLRAHNADAGGGEPREMADFVPQREERPVRAADRGNGNGNGNGYGYRGPARAAETWDIQSSDKTLQGAVARWANAAGWQLSWELPVDYPVDARASIGGSFEGAVEAVVRSMERAEVPMKAIFYKGNRVLRIVAKGAE